MRNNISYKTLLKEVTKLKVFLAIFLVASISLFGYGIASNTYAADFELILNPNGGYYAGTNGITTLNVSSYTVTNNSIGKALKAGTSSTFKGWYTAATGGTQVFDANGYATENGNYWSGSSSTGYPVTSLTITSSYTTDGFEATTNSSGTAVINQFNDNVYENWAGFDDVPIIYVAGSKLTNAFAWELWKSWDEGRTTYTTGKYITESGRYSVYATVDQSTDTATIYVSAAINRMWIHTDNLTLYAQFRATHEIFAEFNSSTGVLRIFRDVADAYTDGQTSGTKTYYAGIEAITGDTNPKWLSKGASIKSIVIEDSFKPLTAYRLFSDCTNLTSITGMSNLDTSQVTTMEMMFRNCSSLTSLDLSSFDTSNVTTMEDMFEGCSSLTSLNLSSFNTSQVTSMVSMFTGCSSLTSLNLSSFNTSQVTSMVSMFSGCSSLTSLNLSSFNTGNVTDMKCMFQGCRSLTSLNLSNFDTSNVISMQQMFYECNSLESLNISSFNTSEVTGMAYMFTNTSSLKVLSLGTNFSFIGTNQELAGTWRRDGDTTVYPVTNLITNYSGSTMAGTYRRSEAYAEFDSSTGILRIFRDYVGVYTDGETNGTKTYYAEIESVPDNTNPKWYSNRASITSVAIEDVFMPLTAYRMFYGCTNLTRITGMSNIDASQITNMAYMFYNCSSLTNLDLRNFNTTAPKSYMFTNTSSLKVLSLGTNFRFSGTYPGLTGNWRRDGNSTIYTASNLMSNYNGSTMAGTYRRIPDGEAYAEFDSSTGVLRIFRDDAGTYTNGQTSGTKTYYTGIESITGETRPKWYSNRTSITSVVIEDEFMPLTAYLMFNGCTNLTSITGISNLDTSQVITMHAMFTACRSLTSLDLYDFNTENVTNMSYMFSGCSGLASLNVSGFNTSQVTTMSDMFENCSGLTSLNLSNFNTKNVTSMVYMFCDCSNLTSLNLSSFDTSNVTSIGSMFQGCSSLVSLDLNGFNTSKVTSMTGMFGGCNKLASLNVSGFNTSQVTTMNSMFYECTNLTSLNLSSFNTSQVTNMYQMFYGCSSLTSLNLINFNTSNVTNMSMMFDSCRSLTSLDLSSFNTSSVTTMADMFYNTAQLTTLKLGTDWNFLSNNGLTKSWLRDGDTTVYTAAQLTTAYDGSTMSGTYRAYQALTITETVKGTLAELNKEFDFTINVTNGGAAIDSTHAYTGTKSGNLVFNNGIATFTLKHADNITTYLPYGVSYTITQGRDGYTLTKTNDTGTLTYDKTAAFIDTLNGTVPTGIFSKLLPYMVLILFSSLFVIIIIVLYRNKKKR